MDPRQRLVLKIGGSTLGQHDTTLEDIVWLARQGRQAVVVHGGGKTITEWLNRQGVVSRFVNGLRVTDEESIAVVVAVLAGLVNKQLVATINALGGRAVGLSGADGGLLRTRVMDPALGLVGEPVGVDTGIIETLLAGGCTPVISPVGVLEMDGTLTPTLLNVNADSAAAEIGGALKAEQLIFLTDVPGVKGEDGNVIPRLSQSRIVELIASGVISGGMVPKVEGCLRALRNVPSAVILDGRRPHALRDYLTEQATGDAHDIGTRIE